MRVGRLSGIFALSLGCAAALLSSGCAWYGSSLATNSGPRAAHGQWSVKMDQWVHVGEQIDVDYALHMGTADYALLDIEPLGTCKVSLVGDRGRFLFEGIRFAEPTLPKKPLTLYASAYRERGERDVMDMDGKLLRRESPYDIGDKKVASARLKVHVYQSSLAIQVPPDPAGYNWETAKLLLYARPERPAEVRAGRDYRKGFRVEGPTAAGSFLVVYEPTAEQVKHTESTRVVLSVMNAAGHEYRQEIWLPTP